MTESLVEVVSRFVPLATNGSEATARCVFCSSGTDTLKVDDRAWRTLCCGQEDVNGADSAGFLMSWSGCSREDAEHQLGNGGLPPAMPVQVQPLRRACFWGLRALLDAPKGTNAIVWVHWVADGVHFGREHLSDGRVHLGLCSGRPFDDESISLLDGRSCILIPDNRESSFERMDELASKLYAAGHAKVRYVKVAGQEDCWAFPGQLSPTDALAFVQKHVLTYPNNGAVQDGVATTRGTQMTVAPATAPPTNALPSGPHTHAVSAPGPQGGAPISATPVSCEKDVDTDISNEINNKRAPRAPDMLASSTSINAAPTPAPAVASGHHPLVPPPIDTAGVGDAPNIAPERSGSPRKPKRTNGQAGAPLPPSESVRAFLESERQAVLDGLVYTCIADVKPEAVRWLWPGRIPLGELTMIVGDPGLGKSQITASLASVVTNGGQWPVDRNRAEVGSVLILSAEDNIKHTIRPRLDAAGANVRRCHTLQAVKRNTEAGTSFESSFNLAEDLAKLSVLMDELEDVRMVIIDPVSAYLGETDSHKNAEVRGMLAPLTTLAGNHDAAIILVSHLTKSQSANALMRVQGSIAFAALCRAVWGVTSDKDNRQRRLFMPLKNNLGQDKTGLAYAIEGMEIEDHIPTSRVMWESEPVETTIDEAFGATLSHEERSEIDDVKEFLRDALASGRVKASEVQRSAKIAGHSLTTLGRAKRTMKIISEPEGFGTGRVWYWRLQADEPPSERRNWVPDD